MEGHHFPVLGATLKLGPNCHMLLRFVIRLLLLVSIKTKSNGSIPQSLVFLFFNIDVRKSYQESVTPISDLRITKTREGYLIRRCLSILYLTDWRLHDTGKKKALKVIEMNEFAQFWLVVKNIVIHGNETLRR